MSKDTLFICLLRLLTENPSDSRTDGFNSTCSNSSWEIELFTPPTSNGATVAQTPPTSNAAAVAQTKLVSLPCHVLTLFRILLLNRLSILILGLF